MMSDDFISVLPYNVYHLSPLYTLFRTIVQVMVHVKIILVHFSHENPYEWEYLELDENSVNMTDDYL